MIEPATLAHPPEPGPSGPGARNAGSAAEILHEGEIHLPLVRQLLREGLAVRLRVGGRSMEPFVADGDLVTLRSVVPGAIRLGDLVFSQEPGVAPLLHRVVSRRRDPADSWIIRTKGDAAGRPDAPVRGEHVLGRVVAIRRELPPGGHVEFHLGARPRALVLTMALASRFAPRIFAALSRRLVRAVGAIRVRPLRARVVA